MSTLKKIKEELGSLCEIKRSLKRTRNFSEIGVIYARAESLISYCNSILLDNNDLVICIFPIDKDKPRLKAYAIPRLKRFFSCKTDLAFSFDKEFSEPFCIGRPVERLDENERSDLHSLMWAIHDNYSILKKAIGE